MKQVGMRLHRLIKGSRLVAIDGAEHFVHQDALHKVTHEIKEFLK
jgi:pimeloyl-ACP methyl ester carboxylesterase